MGALVLVSAGCISTETTEYRDVERVPVTFENETAARLFYEALSQRPSAKTGSESKTEVCLPIIFDHKRRVVTGNNATFNEAVNLCDSNRDGKITELEAKIFSEVKPKS